MSGANGNGSSSRCTLLLVRHAHTDMAGRFCGISDPPLSAQGVAQLPALSEKLMAWPITHVFSSELQRARQTADFIAEHRKLQVSYLDFLHELAFGSWEGLDWDQIVARDREYAQRWLDNYPFVPAPGGEYFEDFVRRIRSAMTTIAAQAEGGCAAVVTHAGVIRTFLGSIMGQATAWDCISCDYASVQQVSHQDGAWRLAADLLERPVTSARHVPSGPSGVQP